MIKYFIVIILILVFSECFAATYYISPTGDDADNGLTTSAPWKTFSHAFLSISPGDTLMLMDGTYSIAAGTGVMNFSGTNSAQIPSGVDAANPTVIQAVNMGSAFVDGTGDYEDNAVFIGRSTAKHSYITITGVMLKTGAQLYNTNRVKLKNCGIHGALRVGTADHTMGNTYNLIEDVWVWAEDERIIVTNYVADYTVWRRVVVRGDGCDTATCTGGGSPNVGMTVYNSQNVSVQNVFIVDRILGGGTPYADFATAQHSTPNNNSPLLNNEWLGCASIATGDTWAYNFEADLSSSPSNYMKNCVATFGGTSAGGFNTANGKDVIREGLTVVSLNTTSGDMFRHDGSSTGSISRNLIADGNARYGINSGGTSSYIDTYGTYTNGRYYNTTVSPGELITDPDLTYVFRVESGSSLEGAGYNGENYGATIVNRYGTDGTFHGDAGYNTLSSTSLFPYPNEDMIKSQMAADSTRGFCSAGTSIGGDPITLTSYMWEYLGNECPVDICLPTIFSTGSMPLMTN